MNREWLVIAVADTRAKCARAGSHLGVHFAAPQSPLLLASFEKELGGDAGKPLRQFLIATDGLHLGIDNGGSLSLLSTARIVEGSRYVETLTGRKFLVFADFHNGLHAAIDPNDTPANGEYPIVEINYNTCHDLRAGGSPRVIAASLREFVAKALATAGERKTFAYWL